MFAETLGYVIFSCFVLSQIIFWQYAFKNLKKESPQRKLILSLIVLTFIIIKIFFSQPYYGSEDDDDLYIYERLYVMLFPQTELNPNWYGASEDPSLINYVIYPFFRLVLAFNPLFKLFPSQITFFTLYSSIVMLVSFYLLIKSLFKETSFLPILILVLSQNFFYFSRSLSYIFISHSYFLSALILLYFFERKKGPKRCLLLFSSFFLLLYSSFVKVDNRIFILLYIIYWLNLRKVPFRKVILYSLALVPIPFVSSQFSRRSLNYLKSKTILSMIQSLPLFLFKSYNSFIFLIAFIFSIFLFSDNFFIIIYFFTFLFMYSFSYSVDAMLVRFRYTNALIAPSLLVLVAVLNKEFFKQKKYLKNLIYIILIGLQLLSFFLTPIHYDKSERINYLESKSFEGISDVVYLLPIFGSRPLDYALILKSKNPDIVIRPLSVIIENHSVSIELKKIFLKDIFIPDSCNNDIPPEKVSQIFTNLTLEQIRPYCYDFKWVTIEHAFDDYMKSLNKSYPLKEINFLLIRSEPSKYDISESYEKLLDVFRSSCVVEELESPSDLVRFYNVTC